MLFLGLVPAVGALLAFVHWPPLGLIALIVTALIVPSPRLPGGFNLAVLLLVLLIGLWLVDLILGQPEKSPVSSRTFRPLLALVLVATLALAIGQLPWFTLAQSAPIDAQIGGLVMYVLAAGAFLLAAYQVRDLRWLKWMTWIFVAFGALHTAGWLVPGMGSITGRLFQPGTYNNSIFWTWPVALAFGQALYNRSKATPGLAAGIGRPGLGDDICRLFHEQRLEIGLFATNSCRSRCHRRPLVASRAGSGPARDRARPIPWVAGHRYGPIQLLYPPRSLANRA